MEDRNVNSNQEQEGISVNEDPEKILEGETVLTDGGHEDTDRIYTTYEIAADTILASSYGAASASAYVGKPTIAAGLAIAGTIPKAVQYLRN